MYVCITNQVCKTFKPHIAKATGVCSKAEVAETNRRHKAWLLNGRFAKQAWRPTKYFRKATVQVLKNLDSHLKVSTPWSGLKHLQYVKPEENLAGEVQGWRSHNWRTWPSLTSCQDEGPDMVSSMHASQYTLLLNIMEWWDWSHGCSADAKLVLGQLELWPLMILLLVVSNTGHGPERDEMLRFHQLNESLQWLFTNFEASTSDLFQTRAPQMLEELGSKIVFEEGLSANECLYQFLRVNAEYPKLGTKGRMAQFLGWHERNDELLGEWTSRLFKAEVLALEHDWLAGKAVTDRIKITASSAQAAVDPGSTSTVAQADVKLLRGAQVNAVVIAVLTLEQQQHKRIVHGITAIMKPLQIWRGRSAKHTRSVKECRVWWQEQQKGAFIQHLLDTFAVLKQPQFIKDCDFHAFQFLGHYGPGDAQYEEDERMAALFGDMDLRLNAARLRRCIYSFYGLPHSLTDVHWDKNSRQVERFQKLCRVWVKLQEHRARFGLDKLAEDYYNRSQFRKISTMHWWHAFNQENWVCSAKIKDFAHEQAGGMSSSLIVEEQVHYMKNSKQARAARRVRRPQRAMGQSLQATCLPAGSTSRSFHWILQSHQRHAS